MTGNHRNNISLHNNGEENINMHINILHQFWVKKYFSWKIQFGIRRYLY
jgi:hypothetical protein